MCWQNAAISQANHAQTNTTRTTKVQSFYWGGEINVFVIPPLTVIVYNINVAGFKLSPSEGVASRALGLRWRTETKAIDVVR